MKTQYRVLAVIMLVALMSGLFLAVSRPASAAFESSPIGYASLNGGTTGGAGGTSVTVTSGAALQAAVDNKGSQPLIINVQGRLTHSAGRVVIKDKSDISIIGTGSGGELDGFGLTVQQSHNIIIRNLKIHHTASDDKDAIQLNGDVTNVWVDHNELYNDLDHDKDYYDGLLDITHASDYITVSWNYFHTHWKGSLIGHSDDNGSEDQGHFRVTYHHNYFLDVNSRLPSNRFGTVHVYNNYYRNIATSGVSSRMGACTRIERNYFDNVVDPVITDQSDETGSVQLLDNVFVNSDSPATSPTCSLSVPYSYSADPVGQVPGIVTAGAGVGKLGQNPPTVIPPTGVPSTVNPGSGVSINAGGSATGSFGADQYYSGGSTYTTTNTIDTSQISGSVPPTAVLQSERYGAFTYTIPNRGAGSAQTVTLYFVESYVTAAGQRLFNVSINGSTVLNSFDIYASAGGQNRAIARSFNTTANSSGQVVIQFIAGTQSPKINGITVAGGSVNPTQVSPTGVPPTGVPPTSIPPTTNPGSSVSINAGGSATGSFLADQYYSGGSTYTNSNTIDISQVGSVPVAVFQSERYGAMTYTIPNRTAGSAQTVTLYFAETYVTAAGQRLFNVSINGSTVLSSFDIYASAGGQNRAIARSFNTTANSSGQVVIQFIAGTQSPKINGITVTGGSVNPTQIPPTGVPPTSVPPTSAPPTANPGSGVSINAGGSATGSFLADQYYSGGSTYTNTATIDMSQITTNPPPAAIFNTERYGAMTYTISNRSGAQTVTLYFAETYVTAAGQRLFNVSINGTAALSNFDIYASAGGQNRAIARSFNTTANSSSQVVIQFTAVTENPKINGITMTGGGGGSSYQRGPNPTLASVAATSGTFATAQVTVPAGSDFGGGYIYYPTDTSLGTWAAVAICPGYSARFANEEAWMGPWLASFGFVVIGMETNTTSDGADARATQLLAALDYLTQQSSVRDRVDPNRLMVMGHSAGGAGALTAALQRSSLKTVVGLAPGAPSSSLSMSNLSMPIMIIGGQNDTTVTPSYLNGIWTSIPSTTQRAWVELAGNDHLSFTRSNGTEMRVLIPWMKIFLDNDTRYTQFLCPLADSSGISNYRNSCPFVA